MYAEDNLLLGSITVPVPVGPEGKEKVRVRYTYDINGILVVDVHVVSTGQEKQLVIRNDKIKLSEKELNKVFWRSYQALGCYTYDKQQGISYMRALLPALQKLYPDPEDLKEALGRVEHFIQRLRAE